MKTTASRRAFDGLGRLLATHQGMTLPLAAVAIVVFVDLVTGHNHFLAPMMVMAPALAAGTTTWRRTLLTGLIGAVAQSLLLAYNGLGAADRKIVVGLSVGYAAVTLFSVYAAWWRADRTAQYRAVVSVAEAAQRALLRPPGPLVGHVRLAVRYASAADAAQIGGDLYAVLDTPHGVRALVGDVRGKGLGAVQTSAVVMGAFREAAYDEGGLTKVAERVDTSVRRHVQDGEFITALFLEFPAPAAGLPDLDTAASPGSGAGPGAAASPDALALEPDGRLAPDTGASPGSGAGPGAAAAPDAGAGGLSGVPDEVVMLHYGHVPGLVVSADGSVRTLEPPDPWVPLGLTGFVPGGPVPWRVPLGSDDVLVLCTDGVIEARAAGDDGDFYPLTERAGPLLRGCADDLADAVDRLYADLLQHAGGTLSDDSVLLLLSCPGPAPAAPDAAG